MTVLCELQCKCNVHSDRLELANMGWSYSFKEMCRPELKGPISVNVHTLSSKYLNFKPRVSLSFMCICHTHRAIQVPRIDRLKRRQTKQ